MASERWKVSKEPYMYMSEIQIQSEDGQRIIGVLPGGVSSEIERRARLIAAAPALLCALEAARDWIQAEGCDCEPDEIGTCALCLVEAAIAAATGGEREG